MSRKKTFRLTLGGGLFLSVAAVVAANYARDPSFLDFQWKLMREPPVEVKLTPVTRAGVVRTIEAPGRVEADVEVKISSQVMGRIIKLPVQEGDRIRKGDLLVQIDPVQYEADLKAALARIIRLKAAIRVAESDIGKSRNDVERARKLFRSKAVSAAELLDCETAYSKDNSRLAMSNAELNDAQANLVRLKADLAYTTIRSPINGVVSQLSAKEGEVVVIGTMNNPGTMILSISQPSSMVVRARVDENHVQLVKPGQKSLIYLQSDNKVVLEGTVLRVSPKGTRANSTTTTSANGATSDNEVAYFETVIAINSADAKAGSLKARRASGGQAYMGMSANVEIQVEEHKNVLTVPTQAVQHRRAKDLPRSVVDAAGDDLPKAKGVKDASRRYYPVVFVAQGDKAVCRAVKVGISDDNRVEVLDGLKEGEQVITGPYRVFDQLKENKAVTPLPDTDDQP
jgi:HlyD family secretion protein